MSKKLKKILYDVVPRKEWTEDLLGKRFNDFEVVMFLGVSKKKGNMWLCKCVCGNKIELPTSYLKEPKIRNCGCKYVNPAAKHNMHGSRMYRIWARMISRCHNKNTLDYERYGGRGISVCEEWRTSFVNFYNDMKDGYADNLTIDRYPDNNGNYCKQNCRWATDEQQRRNKRNNCWYEKNGLRMIKADWATHLGVTSEIINHRLNEGWSFDKIYDYYKNKQLHGNVY